MKKILLSAAAVVALLSGAAQAGPLSRYQLVIINESKGSAITSIYAYNLDTSSNKGDVLPGTIEWGESKTIDLDDGSRSCRWRLRAELANDAKTGWVVYDVCRAETWTITEK